MYRLVWEFDAQPERADEFDQVYGADGQWADFFRRSPEYLGTQLYRNTQNPLRFIAVDQWRSRASYETFRKNNAADYATLDAWCRQLLTHERMLGVTDDGKN
jgi:quinol monooxygenase YgiN